MKKLFTLLTTLVITTSVMAQAPAKMSYQAVVRDASNALVTSQAVGMQISILQGSISGSAVYEETQTPTSNINGLVSIEIGSGTVVSGTFNSIDWSNGPYFIKTETDPTGGTTYTITGTSQLMSVPYSLHSNTADSIIGGVSITEIDPVFGASIAGGITAADTANWNSVGTYSAGSGLDLTGSTFIIDPTDFNSAKPALTSYTELDSTSTGTTEVTIQSASITVPGPGKIVATGSVDVYCNVGCVSAGDFADAFITLSTSPTASPISGSYAYMYVNWLNTNSSTRTAVFDVIAAGTTTVYMRGQGGGSGSGTEIGFYRGQVTLLFIPN